VSLTWGPAHEDDNPEGLAVAAAGQVDVEWGQAPLAARSDAHSEVEGLTPVQDEGDAPGQLVQIY
jgi:hypothetical protein